MKRLSLGATLAWDISAQEAAASKSQFIEKEHLFIAVLSLDKVTALRPEALGISPQDWDGLCSEQRALGEVLSRLALDMPALRRAVRNRLGAGNAVRAEKVIHRSEECKALFGRADALSTSEDIRSLHLFAAILETPGPVISSVLNDLAVSIGKLRDLLLTTGSDRLSVKVEERPEPNQKKNRPVCEEPADSTPCLDRYGRDLTREAREGRLGPFVGRRKELLQIVQTLARSSKNNPVLVGEAGVGKTAIVEALALRGFRGKDAQVLSGKRFVELNMGTLTGGTKFRGEFEERLTRLVDEVKNHPEVIVFIDELHNLMGAGRAEGGMDAANLLKPALARGDFRCIGATTIEEFRRHIENDPALERRFEKIVIGEPSREEALEILKGLRPKLERHHGVCISDKAIDASVDLSVRFDADHRLPDKAIDLLDKAGSRVRVPVLSMGFGGQTCEGRQAKRSDVTGRTVAEVLSEKTGVPLEIIIGAVHGTAGSRILDLEPFLRRHIIGQDEAIGRICQRLRMSYSGVGKRNGPLAVCLLLGPTGVGKTELARSLAAFLFGRDSEMIRIDMSEYMEEHTVSKLIGAPPGYVGYEDEGQLTGRLRTKPHSVVLFDEVEKAHPKVFDILLQLFDEGRLTDAKGRTVDGKNAVFVMTSNIRPDLVRARPIGFGEKETEAESDSPPVLKELRKHFREELINRIDEIILFHHLAEGDVRRILRLMLDEIAADLKDQHGTTVSFSPEAEDLIVQEGYSPQYGVRELRRTVERLVLSPLSSLALTGRLREERTWRVAEREGRISMEPTPPYAVTPPAGSDPVGR